jgi:hypothetical protein
MYHDRTAWRCAFFVGKKYGCSKGYPQRNAAHIGGISLWISFASSCCAPGKKEEYISVEGVVFGPSKMAASRNVDVIKK